MIEGKKVRLRAIEEKDLEFCQVLHNDPYTRQMVVGWDFPVSMEKQEKWFQSIAQSRNDLRLVVEDKEGHTLGLTGLWEIDWHNRNALTAVKLKVDTISRKGYGRDAIMAMNAYAFFEVGLYRLWGMILDYNIPSFKAYVEKSGWKVEGILRQHVYRNGAFHDLYYVACLKEDFLALADASDYIPSVVPEGMAKFKAGIFKNE